MEPYGSTGVLAIMDGSPAQRSTTNLDRIVRDAAGLSRSIDRVAGLTFPRETFEQLRGAGLLLAPLPPELGGAGLGTQPGATGALLQILTLIGAADLAVGRIYEGHCNALQLITAFGTSDQSRQAAADAGAGHIFGVWNTDAPEDTVRIRGHGQEYGMSGAKDFCSGAGYVSRPIVTARQDDGAARMCIVPMERCATDIDLTAWKPLGMEASLSGQVRFDGVILDKAALLGGDNDYAREPWFRGGAIRFAAVHLGGAVSLSDITRSHIRQTGRDADISQTERIGQMVIAIEGGRAWLGHAAMAFDNCLDRPSVRAASKLVGCANMMRLAIERICLDCLELAIRSVGVAGLSRGHPLEQVVRDLTTYLRQPAPDAALISVGLEAIASFGEDIG